MSTEPLTASTTLQRSASDAFDLFTTRFEDWWPREFSWSGTELLERIGIEPRVGGALYEIGPGRLRWDWGRVLQCEPPFRLAFSWQIGPDRVPVPDPSQASEVRVEFQPGDDETTVHVVHDAWDRHGADAGPYREAFAQVWPHALERLASLAARG